MPHQPNIMSILILDSDSVLREDIINESFIKDVIKKRYGEKKILCSYKSKVGTEKGDNFMGDLIACEIKVKDQERNEEQILHWMLKTMKVGKGSKAIQEMNLFSREEAFYTQFQNDLDKYIKPNLLRIVPLIHSVNEVNREVLVFENLNALDYETPINKKKGFDDNHVHSVCKWLAELHGAAYVLFQRYPGGYAEWKNNNFFYKYLGDENFEKFFDTMPRDIENILNNLMNGSDNDALIESFKSSINDFFNEDSDHISIATKIKERIYNSRSDFKTLCHGDPWFNNMMFKYDDAKKVKDVILLDMQIIYSGNIGADLAYFLYSSVTSEDLSNKLDSYLEYYRKCLISFVNEIDPDIRMFRTLISLIWIFLTLRI
ncbi:unnamed protein product [Lepeophtheirus salmonis]|uniref:(salmon louse) hypothetical protein n=1 Tax=Lepeophtheirus salmonis TaxID=72036 RepID=A0A7R8D0V8_LEPSM|nr:unnamed protein product [Lepeophtheirus salmonis]CAF2944837.1 unnamed protein product [Lepeophtheirus salmonis]